MRRPDTRTYADENANRNGAGRRPKGSGMKRIGYAAGAYDLFHVGHLNLLKHAKQQCDVLIAGVVSDEMLVVSKGREPVVSTMERAEIVRHISVVDDVYVERVPDKLEVWEEVRFTHFFKGDDWRGTEKGLLLEERFAAVGVEVVYFPYTAHTSSTALRRALQLLETPVVELQGTERRAVSTPLLV